MRKLTQEQFLDKFREADVDNEYSTDSIYINAKTKISVLHKACGTETMVRPDDFLRGRRCPVCALNKRAKKRAKTTEDFKKQVSDRVGDEYHVLSEYKNWKTKVKFRHEVCGHEYFAEPNGFLQGRRCPKCNTPHGELYIEKYLKDNEIPYEAQFSIEELKDRRRLSYDFLVKDQNILIEYQGGQHYKPIKLFGGEERFIIQQEHDEMKRRYARDNGYRLLEIKYTYNTQEKVNRYLDDKLNDM